MKLNLDELKKVAEAARDSRSGYAYEYESEFNPTVALALIERIEKLERYIKEIEEAPEWYEDEGDS